MTAADSDDQATTAGGTEVHENEILFARRELPHYLSETILDGDTRVTVIPSCERPSQMVPQDTDETLNLCEHRQILDSAINEYIDKFGVDPNAPKVQIIDGEPYTNEETQKLSTREGLNRGRVQTEQSAVTHSPNPINGTMRVHILEAADEQHRPHEAWYDASTEAWNRFSTFGPSTSVSVYYGYWEPTEKGDNDDNLLDHLRKNHSDKQVEDNDLVAGWVDHANRNGRAAKNGFYSVSATSADGINWPHDSIFQHELSHNLGADHPRNGIGCTNLPCIMSYVSAYAGETAYCDVCFDEVLANMS
ncbi:MAG: hypothetical protein A07HR60_00274 [uncultured archaeon A07HR60]|nr:MAG: hypothetical protein A07HR60_00274 [uncultured archaeon A07HR60]